MVTALVGRQACVPEIQIVHRALLISHKDIEREEIHWRKGPSAQNFKKSWEPIPIQIGYRGWGVVAHDGLAGGVESRWWFVIA